VYHICKHLVHLYVSEERLQGNCIPLPRYGYVNRQSKTPVLWIKGIHSLKQLFEYDLQSNHDGPGSILLSTEIMDIEESSDPETSAIIIRRESQEEDLNMPYDNKEEEEEDDSVVDWDSSQAEESGFGESYNDEGFGDIDTTEEEKEEWMHQELKGEQIEEQADLLWKWVACLHDTLNEVSQYPSTHQHLREISAFNDCNLKVLLDWACCRAIIQNARSTPTIWSPAWRGNMFI